MALPRAASRLLVWIVAALTFLVGASAFTEAARYYGRPIAGVLVDPGAVVSSMGPSDWAGYRSGLRFPDHIVEVDGRSVRQGAPAPRASVFDEAVARLASEGRSTVPVTVETRGGLRLLELPIHPLDGIAWWLLGGVLFFAGALYIIAGLVALWASPRGALARSWGALTTSAGLFLFTLFDFHTSRTLVPVFFLAFALVPVGLVVLPLRLPDNAAILVRFPWLERALYLLGGAVAAVFISVWATGGSTRELQVHWSRIFGCAFLFFVAVFLVRFARARGDRRAVLRALLFAMVPPLAVLGFSHLSGKFAWAADLVTYPALSLPPLATAYAFVRHDLWGSRALLSRVLVNVFVTGMIASLAMGIGSALASKLGAPFPAALAGSAAAGVLAAIAVALSLAAVERTLFPALAEYKPTIEQLSEQLINITSPEQVARAIERNVERWLPCELIELELEEPERRPSAAPGAAHDDSPRVRHESGSEGQLTLPVTFGGQRLGTLRVGRKQGGALFSRDDLDLLYTIVNQGALALAHAHVYRELEARRRQQAAAWRGEREALVETVAAEIAHEVRYPLNFFRTSFERLARGEPLDGEDVDIGREEIDRLERMVSGLRRMAAHRMQRQPVRLLEVCGRAEVLLRDALGDRRIHVAVDPSVEVRCDPDQATQIVVNLVSNALEAAGDDGDVGIELVVDDEGSAELRVWDSGAGFVGDASRLFAPWYTTKDRGTGLGLAITHRLVRAHGWNVAAARLGEVTVFCVRIPKNDVRAAGGSTQSKVKVA
jgi:signal transduction histidine kinase